MSSVSCDAVKYEDPVVETSAMGPVHSSTFAPLDTGQPPPHLPPRSLDHKGSRFKLRDEDTTDPTKKQLYSLLLEEYKSPGAASAGDQPQELVRRNSVSSSSLCSVESSCTPPLKDINNSCDITDAATNGDSRKRSLPLSSYHPKKKFLRGFQEETAAANKEKLNEEKALALNKSLAHDTSSTTSSPVDVRPPSITRSNLTPPLGGGRLLTPPTQNSHLSPRSALHRGSSISSAPSPPSVNERTPPPPHHRSSPLATVNTLTNGHSTVVDPTSSAPPSPASVPADGGPLSPNAIPRNLRMRNVIESLMSTDVIRRHLEDDTDKYSTGSEGHATFTQQQQPAQQRQGSLTNYTQTSDVPGYQKALEAVFARRADAQRTSISSSTTCSITAGVTPTGARKRSDPSITDRLVDTAATFKQKQTNINVSVSMYSDSHNDQMQQQITLQHQQQQQQQQHQQQQQQQHIQHLHKIQQAQQIQKQLQIQKQQQQQIQQQHHIQQQQQQQQHHIQQQHQHHIHQQQQHLWAQQQKQQQQQLLLQQKDTTTRKIQRLHNSISPTEIYRRAGYDSLPVNNYAVPYDHLLNPADKPELREGSYIDLTSDSNHELGSSTSRHPYIAPLSAGQRVSPHHPSASQLPPPLIAVKHTNGVTTAEIPLDLSMKASQPQPTQPSQQSSPKQLPDMSPSLLQAYQNAPQPLLNHTSAKQRVLYSQPKLSKHEQRMPTTLAEPLSRVSSGNSSGGGNSFLGNYPPNDILFLRCRLCGLTYGSQHSIRKHFAKTHGLDPTADTVSVQSISATKKAMSERAAAAATGQDGDGQPKPIPAPIPIPPPPPPPPQYIDPNSYVSEYAIEYGGTDAIAAAMEMTANISKGKLAVRSSTAANSKLKTYAYTSNGKEKIKPNITVVTTSSINTSSTTTSTTSTTSTTTPAVDTITKDENDDKSMMRCLQCGKDFPTRDWGVFRRHVRAHDAPSSGATFRCTVCPAAFINAASRRAHMSTSHQLTTCSCKVCDIGFTHIGALRKHLRTAHSTAAPGTIEVEYRCLYCPRSFSAQCDLETHTIRHEYDDSVNATKDSTDTTSVKPPVQLVSNAENSTQSLLNSDDSSTTGGATTAASNTNVKHDPLNMIPQSPPPDSDSKDVGLLKKHLLAETKQTITATKKPTSPKSKDIVANRKVISPTNDKKVTPHSIKASKSVDDIKEENKLEARRKTDLWFSKLSRDRKNIKSNGIHKPLEKGVFTAELVAKIKQEISRELKTSSSHASEDNKAKDMNGPSTSVPRNKMDFRDLHTTLCMDHACEDNYLRDEQGEQDQDHPQPHHHHPAQPVTRVDITNSDPKFKAFDVGAALMFADAEKQGTSFDVQQPMEPSTSETSVSETILRPPSIKESISLVIMDKRTITTTTTDLHAASMHYDTSRVGIPTLSHEGHSDSN